MEPNKTYFVLQILWYEYNKYEKNMKNTKNNGIWFSNKMSALDKMVMVNSSFDLLFKSLNAKWIKG